MSGTFKLFLKANEKVFINGAVIRADRKVGIELLNDVDFLLENHVMQVEDANSPLRQLYFIVQIMLMSPGEKAAALKLYRDSIKALLATFQNEEICSALKAVDCLVGENKPFEALKAIRALFALEDSVLARQADTAPTAAIDDYEPAAAAG